ncbi:MAG: F0F1 ATP synthase subunit A [Candidatus Amulumruptor caecigallinarius]|nr:F0F1 ATP synthase subunit A [Candidatus Amulumruptor caecigallinarius]
MSNLNALQRMNRYLLRGGMFAWLVIVLAILIPESVNASNVKQDEMDVKEIIFEHLGDGYGWEVPFSHSRRIPLPVIVRAEDGEWFCFSSARLTKLVSHMDEATGKTHESLEPVVYTTNRNGKSYSFEIATTGPHKDKVVEIFPGSNSTNEGEYRPWDFSITKNVCALFITMLIVIAVVLGLVRYYRKNNLKAPRKGMGFFEMLVGFVYYDVIKATLGKKTEKFAPYLLTAFFFILTMNLVGLIVIFPGGANLTGNIAITLVLAVLTFIMTNVLGTKDYWKEIFWPDVPIWLKFPLPIMQVIEVFGIFTKPAALCVRLFANMMGGHMIVITLTLLIFIFAAFGTAAAGGATVISVLFSLFMLALDVLVSFIQAYVFTMLSAMFIGAAQVHEDEHHVLRDELEDQPDSRDRAELRQEEALLHTEAQAIDK